MMARAKADPGSRSPQAGQILTLGHGAAVALERVVAVANPLSAPVQRLAHEAEGKGLLLNLTFGRRARCVLLLDSGHVVLAPLTPETVLARWTAARQGGGADQGGRP